MIIRIITELGLNQPKLLSPGFQSVLAYSRSCPLKPTCPGKGGGAGGDQGASGAKRGMRSGKCRLGLIPDEWFTFFYKKTGVSGPYLLLLGFTNYVCSKEIYVMEHEYYSGLSIALVLYLLTTRAGAQIGAALDEGVDAVHASFQKERDDQIKMHEENIKECTMGQTRAKGQKELMTAKKENIALQLEAIYRERAMMVYKTVRHRMDYHVKKSSAESRIHQKWMIEWILKQVNAGITPEFQKQAMSSAIVDLAAMSKSAK